MRAAAALPARDLLRARRDLPPRRFDRPFATRATMRGPSRGSLLSRGAPGVAPRSLEPACGTAAMPVFPTPAPDDSSVATLSKRLVASALRTVSRSFTCGEPSGRKNRGVDSAVDSTSDATDSAGDPGSSSCHVMRDCETPKPVVLGRLPCRFGSPPSGLGLRVNRMESVKRWLPCWADSGTAWL